MTTLNTYLTSTGHFLLQVSSQKLAFNRAFHTFALEVKRDKFNGFTCYDVVDEVFSITEMFGDYINDIYRITRYICDEYNGAIKIRYSHHKYWYKRPDSYPVNGPRGSFNAYIAKKINNMEISDKKFQKNMINYYLSGIDADYSKLCYEVIDSLDLQKHPLIPEYISNSYNHGVILGEMYEIIKYGTSGVIPSTDILPDIVTVLDLNNAVQGYKRRYDIWIRILDLIQESTEIATDMRNKIDGEFLISRVYSKDDNAKYNDVICRKNELGVFIRYTYP